MRSAVQFATTMLLLFPLHFSGSGSYGTEASNRFKNTEPAHARGEGPAVCIDKSHRNYHDAQGTYLPFADLLRDDGYRVTSFQEQLTRKNLAECDLLVIVSPVAAPNEKDWAYPNQEAFTKLEVSEILLWIHSGGSLLLVVDHAPFPGAVGDLGTALGLNMFNGKAKDDPGRPLPDLFSISGGNLRPHPIFEGRHEGERVRAVATWIGHAFLASREFEPLIVFGPRSQAWPMLDHTVSKEDLPRSEWPVFQIDGWLNAAAREWGSGRVVVLGEAAMCTQAGAEANQRGMYAPSASDNPQFCLNVVRWLSAGALPAEVRDQAVEVPIGVAAFELMAEYLTRGSRKWKAAVPHREGGPEALGLWFERSARGEMLELNVVAYFEDRVRAGSRSYWFWHPGREEITYHEVSPSGSVRMGATHFTDSRTFVTLTDVFALDGSITPNRGVNVMISDDEHRTVAYAHDGSGEWVERNALSWTRMTDDEVLAGCLRDCPHVGYGIPDTDIPPRPDRPPSYSRSWR